MPASLPDLTTAADAVVTFNEIMYHPAGNDSALEWVELYNQMSIDIELSNWRIEGGIEFHFPANTILPANGYLVMAADPAALQASAGATNVLGPFTKHLSNAGETLRLRNHNGRLMDELTYTDQAPWPVAADGSGASLAKRNRFSASSPGANWRASAQVGGTPGRSNFLEATLNEPPSDQLIAGSSAGRWLVPTNNGLGQSWTLPDFSDATWAAGSASLGFDAGTTQVMVLANVALGKAVIAGSGSYLDNAFNVPDSAGNFTALNVTDGSTSDVFGVNYWLGREGHTGEYLTLDLGGPVLIQQIRLRNTHNTSYNDRGTAQFQLFAAQTIDASKQLVAPQLILTGTLRNVSGLNPIPADVFTPTNGLTVTSARYLKFVALTANNPGNNVGLNEFEVYSWSSLPLARAYSFDGSVADVSGHGYDGQNLGAQFSTVVPPAVGGGLSLQFDGVSSQVRVPDMVNPSAYTLAVWVRLDVVRPCSLVVRTSDNGPTVEWSHQLRINSSGQFEHYLFDGSLRSVAATNVIQPGVWYHVVGTAANGGMMQIYVNGVSSGGSVPLGTLWSGGNQWRFGTDSGQTPNFFSGRLDEVGLWHLVLGPGDIARLATGTLPVLLDGYRGLFVTDVQSSLYRTNSSLYLRVPFNVATGIAYDKLTLNLRYDDGFVAYLNGAEILRRNSPQTLAWNSAALTNRAPSAAIQAESFDLSGFLSSLVPGTNVLAFQALTSAATNSTFLLCAELLARQAPPPPEDIPLGFNEIDAGNSPGFFVELLNRGTNDLPLGGYRIVSSAGGQYAFGPVTLGAGGFTSLTTNQLGFTVQTGDRLFLLGLSQAVVDGVEVNNRLQGKLPSLPTGPWCFPSQATPGTANQFQLHQEIVINEIMYHAPPAYATNISPAALLANDAQWIELYNCSAGTVDLSGWRLDDAIHFTFPSNTVLGPDAYLVIANNATLLRTQYPGITVLGDFSGKLSHRGARILLRDAQDNPVNEVTYYPDFPWPGAANGGGSSLELCDPRADNSVPEVWAASNESAKSSWRHYSYRARAIDPVYAPALYSFHELRLGLLGEGEVLLDNISAVEFPAGLPPRQLLQNTNFTSGTAKWRLVGNHMHSRVESNPDNPANPVLHLIATGPMTYLENQLETTLKVGNTLVPVVAQREYEISFDAKWLTGSPQLHAELYYNKVARTMLLERPTQTGTPGRPNSTRVANAGPTYTGLQHSPVVPTSTQNITVSLQAADPDGVGSLTLHYAVNGGTWQGVPMLSLNMNLPFGTVGTRSTASLTSSEGLGTRWNASLPYWGTQGALKVREVLSPATTYTGTIPAQTAGAVIQFYVEGADVIGATSTYPANGTNSRALIKVDSPRLVPGKQTFRTIMTPADATLLHTFVNLMSDDLLGCTVIHNEREVFYDARLRLHGSMFSRPAADTTGFTVKLPLDHPFRGSRASIVVRRSDLVEVIGKHILNQAGGLPADYDDVIYLVSHRSDNIGNATLNLANYDDTYIDSQFENDKDGTVFKLEGIRVYETTDDGTPEGYKLPQPVDFVWDYDITDLGSDPEQYRWSILIQSQRARDDFSAIVALGKAFSQTNAAALLQAVPAAIDVDEWARYFALQTLLNVMDIYGADNPHNIALYQRSGDGRVVVLQNDWGYAFGNSTGSSIYGKNHIFTILNLPAYRRLYQGHLLDLMNSVYNSAYLTRWAQHFTDVTGVNYNGVLAYAEARDASVRSQLAAQIPFAITSNGGSDFTVNTPSVILEGRGWINVHDIGLAGQTSRLPVAWLDDQRWQILVPLQAGTNQIQLVAYDYRGAQTGQGTIAVITTVSGFAQRDYLRITELMYDPPPITAAEIAAGFSNNDDFEFIELMNTGPTNLSLLGVKFTAGVTFDFTESAITNLIAGQRVLVVAKASAFTFRYGAGLAVAGSYAGHLDNAGELVRLVDSFGVVIQEFTYGNSGNWPGAAHGQGKSLEVLDINGDYSNPANWQASLLDNGSPGAPAIIRPAFIAATQEGARIHLRFQAAAQQAYSLYSTENLVNRPWQILTTIPAGATTRIEEVPDVPSPGASQRFYRLSTP